MREGEHVRLGEHALQILRIDPREHVAAASRVLQDAWQPPCLRYTQEFLNWQFQFPGPPEPVAVLAVDGNEPAGFSAAMPRRIRWRGHSQQMYLLSFFSVRPAWRTLALSIELLRTLSRFVLEVRCPMISFAEADSIGERLMLRNGASHQLHHHNLGFCRTFATLPRPAKGAGPDWAIAPGDEAFLSVIESCQDNRTLWSDPSLEQLRHYQSDPRGRILLTCGGPDERPIAAAMAVRCETLTPQGPQDVAIVDTVFIPNPDAAILTTLLSTTAQSLREKCTTPVLAAPNLSAIDATILRGAGLRETPAGFRCHLFTREPEDTLLDAECTNLEVV